MLADVVVDTNVLVHAATPNEARHEHSRLLVEHLLEAETVLCVDDGFTFDEASNRSIIGYEYIRHLRVGSLSYALVVTLASQGRLCVLPKVPRGDRRRANRINQLIRKPHDRAFLGVACSSIEKTLVSHDFEDFQTPKRSTIRADLSVRVIEADECLLYATQDETGG